MSKVRDTARLTISNAESLQGISKTRAGAKRKGRKAMSTKLHRLIWQEPSVKQAFRDGRLQVHNHDDVTIHNNTGWRKREASHG